jgi:chromosome segregation ATPase
MIFTIGNLITLGIVALALVLYRLADTNNRPLEKVKKYAEKCKEEIAAYADEKSMAVKNFGIDLDVEKKVAAQYLKNIQQLTEEELAKKAEAIKRIDEHIHAFEASLEELTGMTGRVQENLNRIRDESAFVESTGRRISEAKEKFDQIERALNAAEKNLEETESRLERKNSETLDQISQEVLSSAKTIVSDFETTAQTVEQRIEEHKTALEKAERDREAILNRDVELVKKTLKDVLENAGKRADKMEDEALVKLREQAKDRVANIKTFFEDKISSVQDSLKAEQASINEKLKTMQEKCNAEITDMTAKQKNFQQEMTKGSAELDNMTKKQREEIINSLAKQQEEVRDAITKERDVINNALLQQQTDWKQNFQEFKNLSEKQRKELDTSIASSKQEINQMITELKTKSTNALNQQQNDLDAVVKQHQKEISSTLGELKEKTNTVLQKQQQETDTILSKLNSTLSELQTQTNDLYKRQQDELSSIVSDLKSKSDTAYKQQQQELASTLGEMKEKTETAVRTHQQELSATLKELKETANTAVANQHAEINAALSDQTDVWKKLCKDTEQEIITANDKRLADYARLQNESISQLNSLADDAGKLGSELHLAMEEAKTRVRDDFAEFEKESNASMEKVTDAFNAQALVLQRELREMDNTLNSIKQQAFDKANEKLTIFERDFTAELAKRSTDVGTQIDEWQDGFMKHLHASSDKLTSEWMEAEERISTDQRKNMSAMGERLLSELERLKQETTAFEKGIREEMNNVEETRAAFAEQIKLDLAQMRGTAEHEVQTQVGEYQLSMQEVLRQKQKDLEKEIETISEHSRNTYAALDETAANARKTFDEWLSSYNTRIREMDEYLDELRRNSRSTATENEDRINSFRQHLEEIRRELGVQKKIMEQTEEMRQEQDRRAEEVNSSLDRLEQRKNEITEVERQFTHIKQLEHEVHRNMTSFLSEKHRIELMQKDFERFLKTSESVEEKLVQVTTKDDVLQAVQVQIRKLEDAIQEMEDKYQRVERKNEVLEETNKGIDSNFKSMQKAETSIKNAEKIINALSDQFEHLRTSIENLAAENIKAHDAAEKITILNESLALIEKRIEDMNVAREWIANTETRLTKLDKDMKEHLKIAKGIVDKDGKASADRPKGAPAPQDRDNVIRLKGQGWTVEEISKAMNFSIGEVELILEIGSRG